VGDEKHTKGEPDEEGGEGEGGSGAAHQRVSAIHVENVEEERQRRVE